MRAKQKEVSGIQPGTRVKFVGTRAGDIFPTLQGKTTSGKTSLTKSLKSMEAVAQAFTNLDEGEELLTKQRRARALMEALDKSYEKLIEHIHEMQGESFEPYTDPYDMAQSVELTSTEKSREADEKLEEHDESIRKAERILSVQITLENVLPGPPREMERERPAQTPAIPIFRAQSDLKPSPLKASSTFREVKHFCEIFTSYLSAGYGGEDRIPIASNCSPSCLLAGGP